MKNLTKSFILALLLLTAKAYSQQPVLNSLPSDQIIPNVTPTIFIDFDGHRVTSSHWNGGLPINCASPNFTDAQIIEMFNRVSEDFRPFNLNITTDSTKFLTAPYNRRTRIIVTTTSAWRPNVGGIASIGSFTTGNDVPAFVFPDRLAMHPRYTAECISHESGHTLGLAHQSTWIQNGNNCTLEQQYALGSGEGQTSWAPIMGNSYYKNMTGWNEGPTNYGCNYYQDNLTIITSQNGFTYRPDDYNSDLSGFVTPVASSFSVNGIISTNVDEDAFKYTLTQGSAIHIEATPFRLSTENAAANVDLRLDLLNASGALIRTYDPIHQMNIVVDTTLASGTYYMVLSGTGNANTAGYGSIGSYTMTASGGPLPIHDIALTGSASNSKHNLNWTIIADEPIKSQVLEVSTDGSEFKPLSIVNAQQKKFEYTPYVGGTYYYRLKATSVINQVAYSNVTILKSNNKAQQTFAVSTLIQNEISVNAFDGYDYTISDANGRMIKRGKGQPGNNRIDMTNNASGMYIIQLLSKTSKQTERIIKQ